MAVPARTYSLKSSTRPTQGAMNTEKYNIFDNIVLKENILDNCSPNKQTDHGKTATQRRRKKKQSKHVSQAKKTSTSINKSDSRNDNNDATNYRSPMLFYDYGTRKMRVKSLQKQKSKLAKVRQMANENMKKKICEVQNEFYSDSSSVCSAVCEKQEDIEGYVIEEIVSKGQIMVTDLTSSKKNIADVTKLTKNCSIKASTKASREHLSKLQNSVYSNCERMQQEDDDDDSIEIPRDATQNTEHYLQSLTQSHLLPLERSVEETSLTNYRRVNIKPVFAAGFASPRSDESLLSCERTEMSDHSSEEESPTSEYKYSFVSTNTEATDTNSAKTVLSSPAVKKNMWHPLNSTTYKNKDGIGVIEFPDSISPISVKKVKLSHQDKCMLQKVNASHHVEHSKMKENVKNQAPKSSTVLIWSDNSCHFDLMNLSTIYSHNTLTSGSQIKSTHASNATSSREQLTNQNPCTDGNSLSSRDICDVRRQKKSVMGSTPQDNANKMISLSISPIMLHERDDDDELQVDSSRVVNTDEIIVPGSSRDASQKGKLYEGDCSGAAHVQAYRRITSTKVSSSLSNQVQPRHPNSSSKYAAQRDTQKKNVSFDNTFSKAVRIPTSSSCSALSIKTTDEQKDAFQIRTVQDPTDNYNRTIQYSNNNQTRATKSLNKNATETLAKIHKDKGCCHNQYQGKLTMKNKQNSSVCSSCPIVTKKCSEHGLKISSDPNICYVNRLCMASQTLLKKQQLFLMS